MGELLVQPLRPVRIGGEEQDVIDFLIGIALPGADAVDLEASQADLIGFVQIGPVEVGLTIGGNPVPFSNIAAFEAGFESTRSS